MDKNKKYNILIVEDDDSSYLFLQFVLEVRNFIVYRAVDGIEAIKYIENGIIEFHLILMDIKLPKMDGYKASQQIRKNNKYVPIIAQTASYIPDEKYKFTDSQIDAILIKPFTSNLLLRTIEMVLNREIEVNKEQDYQPILLH